MASTLLLQTATYFDHSLFEELQKHLALSWESFEDLEFYRLVTSPFLQTSPGFSGTILGLTYLVVPTFELRAGTARTLLTFFAGDMFSTVPILIVLKVAGAFGNAAASTLANTPDSGSSSGGFACLGALTCALPLKLRLISTTGLVVFFAVRFAFWHRLFDFQHALATAVGASVWLVWEHRNTIQLPESRAARQ
ncbi:MAG: hypothetical protein ABI577_02800 [bacterium]